LVDANVYPSAVLDSGHDYRAALLRAELPDILDELDRTDLVAICEAARLLAIIPRDDEIFTYSDREDAKALARGGHDPRDFGLDPEALGLNAWWLGLHLPQAKMEVTQ
jgi:hypothetical protein